MKLSVVIPVYNEINTIEEILRRVRAVDLEKEIVIVDDGSTDGTREILAEIDDPDTRVIYHPRNRGKGAALRTGFQQVAGDIVVVQDADLEYDPAEFPQLIDLIVRGKADVVYGSRFLGRQRVFMFSHYLGNKLLNFLTNVLYNTNLSDMETCYKAFRADVLKRIELKSSSFGIEPEITAKVFQRNLRVYEVPISYEGRTYDEGKKITWKDGLIALYWLVRCKFSRIEVDKRTMSELGLLRRYYDWIFRLISPFLGQRVLHVGAGLGTFTRKLLGRELVVATESDDEACDRLKERLLESRRLRIRTHDPTQPAEPELHDSDLDTVLCLGELEYCEDDQSMLTNLRAVLADEGRLVLLVPASQTLFGKLDEKMGRRRRYSKSSLSAALKAAGYEVETMCHINALGSIGWLVNSKLFAATRVPRLQLKLFDVLVPILRIERLLHLPFGLSLLTVARRTAGPPNTQHEKA